MEKLLKWLGNNILALEVGFLLIFIPLYPKLPLIDILHTWVYIRLEDFFVLLSALTWFILFVKRKVTLKTPLTAQIIAYWVVGGVSLLFSIIVLRPHLPNFFPNVALLHYLRRIEYLSLFFIAYFAAKSRRNAKVFVCIIAISVFVVSLYAFGQRFLGFPAFLTMNEEFSKGIPLKLASTSRIPSTFGGHYDLAIYLVMCIAFLSGIFFSIKGLGKKFLLFVVLLFGFATLVLTASRVSFAMYIISVSLVLFLHKKKWLILPFVVTSFLLMNLISGGTSDRFGKTLRVQDVVYNAKTGQPISTLEAAKGIEEGEDLPLGSGFINIPKVIEKNSPEATNVAVIKKAIPISLRTATMSSEIATLSGEFLIKPALVYDISFTTRIQGTWNRAIKAFTMSPLLGTGYSSVGLAADNSYLRAMGETGIIGLISFIIILGSMAFLARQAYKFCRGGIERGAVIGFIGLLVGISLNATLIDAFEASKVAYVFWLMTGVVFGLLGAIGFKQKSLWRDLLKLIEKPIVSIALLPVFVFIFFYSSTKSYFVGDDYTWLRWAAESNIGDLAKYFTASNGFFYRPLAKIYFFFAYDFLGLKPQGYHFFSVFLHCLGVVGAYILSLKLTRKKLFSLLSAIFFAISPIVSENLFWISCTSGLMAKTLFIWSLVFYINYREGSRIKPVYYFMSIIGFVLGLASHELMVSLPLILIVWDLLFVDGKKWKKALPIIPYVVILLFYFFVRNNIASSHGLSGDYNYNLSNLLFNFGGNIVGYSAFSLFGPLIIPKYDWLRVSMRENKFLALIILAGGLVVVFENVKRVISNKLLVFLLCWIIICLLPFVGLGNISERYGYPAHFGVIVLVLLMVESFLRRIRSAKTHLFIAGLFFIAGFCFCFNSLKKSETEWIAAGEVSNKTLLALSSNYAEFPTASTLHFINLPIRFGRAWVFPVGLDDGIWFVYRTNDLIIDKNTSLSQAIAISESSPNHYIFIFDNYEIKELKK